MEIEIEREGDRYVVKDYKTGIETVGESVYEALLIQRHINGGRRMGVETRDDSVYDELLAQADAMRDCYGDDADLSSIADDVLGP